MMRCTFGNLQRLLAHVGLLSTSLLLLAEERCTRSLEEILQDGTVSSSASLQTSSPSMHKKTLCRCFYACMIPIYLKYTARNVRIVSSKDRMLRMIIKICIDPLNIPTIFNTSFDMCPQYSCGLHVVLCWIHVCNRMDAFTYWAHSLETYPHGVEIKTPSSLLYICHSLHPKTPCAILFLIQYIITSPRSLSLAVEANIKRSLPSSFTLISSLLDDDETKLDNSDR